MDENVACAAAVRTVERQRCEMGNPKVSIIVPVYNVERYLEQCLESLAGQTLSDIEVLCLDDGSTDASPRMLDEFAQKDSRFHVSHRENSGVAHTRNVGIELAQGDFVLFVDSDDYIAKRACEVLVATAEREGADIVVFGGKTFPTLPWADGSFACRDKVYHSGIDALLYERGSIPLMCNKMYRADFLRSNDLRLNRELTLGEDHAFQFVTFPLAKTVAFTKEMLYFYRVRRDSAVGATRDDGAKQLFLHFDVVKYALGVWKDRGTLLEFTREGVAWAVSFLFNSAKCTYYADRIRFAQVFALFLADVLDGRDPFALDLNPNVENQLRYLLSPQVDEASPMVTILVECADESDDAKEALDSLEFQDEQSFEILFFKPADETSPYAHSVADFIAHDGRARIAASRDPRETLAEARGAYVIRSYANVAYDPQALSQLLQLAGEREGRSVEGERKPYDVAVFADSAGMLGVRDLFDFYEPSVTDPIVPEGPHPASDFGGNLLSFASAATANKAFSKDFLLRCAKDSGCSTWLGLECAALSRAQRIVPTRRPLATLRCLPFTGTGLLGAKAMLDDAYAGFFEARALFAQDDAALGGIDAAAARHLLLMADLIRNPVARRYCVDDARERGAAAIERALAGEQLTDGERTACQALLSESYDEYTGRRDSFTLNSIIEKNEANLLAVGGQAEHIAQLNSDIEEFYQSISYRTGRAVTALPRMAANAARRVLHAVRRG